jgi:plasmid stability protein
VNVRTTIDIPDAMYTRLKARAAGEGRSVKALILQGVQQALRARPAPAPEAVSLPLVKSKRPRSLRIDNARIYDIISFP